MANVGIIGWGFVGKATGNGFSTNEQNKVFWYDKYLESPNTFEEVISESEFIFVCVPTPMLRDYSGVDLSIVEEVVSQIAKETKGTEKIVIIKSSVLPETTASFAAKYPSVNFAMNPEFLTQENAEKDFLNPSRTVIGATSKEVAERVKTLYQTILPDDQTYFLTDTTSAEVVKFMSNLMLASKIILANEYYFLCEKVGIDYDKVRQMVEADGRIGSFIRVPGWDGQFGFGKACFPKDMVGLLGYAKDKGIDMSVLSAVWDKNLKVREVREWEKMDNAFGKGASEKQ